MARVGSLKTRYEQEMGRHPPSLPADHPDAWQWKYRGTKAEREALAQELGLRAANEEPVVLTGQEEMF